MNISDDHIDNAVHAAIKELKKSGYYFTTDQYMCLNDRITTSGYDVTSSVTSYNYAMASCFLSLRWWGSLGNINFHLTFPLIFYRF